MFRLTALFLFGCLFLLAARGPVICGAQDNNDINPPDTGSIDTNNADNTDTEPSANDLLQLNNFGDDNTDSLADIILYEAKGGFLSAGLCDEVTRHYHLAENCLSSPHHRTRLYRRMDGGCNNLDNPNWGKADWPLRRLLEPSYCNNSRNLERCHSNPQKSLPNSREVSLRACPRLPDGEGLDPTASMLLAIMGQLIDHDVAEGPQFEDADCDTDCTIPKPVVCSKIPIADDDVFYSGLDTCMGVPRTVRVEGHNCTEDILVGTQQDHHLNHITSWLDASFVYGSSEGLLKRLREEGSEKLKVKPVSDSSGQPLLGLLPDDNNNANCRATEDGAFKCGLAGDFRAAEQPTLTALHTMFVRFHNNIAEQLWNMNQNFWSKDQTFDEAKKIVSAVWQHLVYNEYLPALLGRETADNYELTIKPGRPTDLHYDNSYTATISEVFAAAAFRLGHSQIFEELETRANDHTILENVPLKDVFFNAQVLLQDDTNRVNGYVLGNIAQRVNKIDNSFSNMIQGNLFFEEDKGFGLDLVAINIRRGREHGIPPYVQYAELCGYNKITSWDDLASEVQDPDLIDTLKELYGDDDEDVRELDAFLGFMLEKHLPGGRVGRTLACILGDQFKRLRIADRFWYEWDRPEGFTDSQLDAIKEMTFSRIICDTLDDGNSLTIQPYALHVPTSESSSNENSFAHYSLETNFPENFLGLPGFSNHRVPCSDAQLIPTLDLRPWDIETECANKATSQFDESLYFIARPGTNHYSAEKECSKCGFHLAYIQSEDEQNFIQGLLEADSVARAWIGLINEEESLVWLDGSNVAYDNRESSNCYLVRSDSTEWLCRPCSQTVPYICEKELSGGQ